MIKDYLGNEIKKGQEICFITVIDRPAFRRIGFLIPSTKEKIWSSEAQEDDKPCWKVGNYYKVRCDKFLGLYYVIESANSSIYVSLQTDMLLDKTDTNILAIKDVSDNEEMYIKSIKSSLNILKVHTT